MINVTSGRKGKYRNERAREEITMKLTSMRRLVTLAGMALALYTGQLRAEVLWSSAGVTDVLNDSLRIKGRCDLNNPGNLQKVIKITASTTDIDVWIEADGAQEPEVFGPDYKLIIEVAAPYTITLHINDNNLSFKGGAIASGSNWVSKFLNVFQRGISGSGMGTVVYKTTAPYKFIFSNDSAQSNPDRRGSGVRKFVSMEGGDNNAVIFRRYNNGSTDEQHTGFWLLNDSLFAFMSDTALSHDHTRNASVLFDTTNTNTTGRYELLLFNSAGFHVGGYLATNVYTDDVAVSPVWTPGGNEVRLTIKGPELATQYDSLRVLNGNSTLPYLLCDPTRSGGYDDPTTGGAINGFVMSLNSLLTLQNGAYLDYVGQTINTNPYVPTSQVYLYGRQASAILKQRNSSALTIDGGLHLGYLGSAPRILLEGASGLFFSSGIDTQTTKSTPASLEETLVNPSFQPTGAGNIVLQVEAPLNMIGALTGTHVINILSREVTPTGGQLELGITPAVPARFPAFTYNKYTSGINDGLYYQYAKACFFVNSTLNSVRTFWRHDDYTHTVSQTNFPDSQPCYIGGDTYFMLKGTPLGAGTLTRPVIALYNGELRLHTSAASTGVDWLTPNSTMSSVDGYSGTFNNTNSLRFYQNGRLVDQGTGRALVLGTRTGSYAYDGATVVDASSYLDEYQTEADPAGSSHTQQLNMNVSPNNHSMIEDIPVGADITDQTSVHTLYLGGKSNIQVGIQEAQLPSWPPTLHPLFNIEANYFSFMTEGGTIGQPELGGSTGEGALFVDVNGRVLLTDTSRANFSMMVVKGHETAEITLPKCRALFNDRVGITFWELDLALRQEIISSGQNLSDFTIDWMATKKDFAGGWRPFEPRPCTCTCETGVTAANLYHIPVVKGQVDELQIKRSRLGDQAQLMVDGGWVRELVFLSGYDSAEASTGLVAVKNAGRVAIGNNETKRDVIDAMVVLGVNGLTLVGDGDGIVEFKTDIVINNVCHILAGPNFGSQETQALYLYSEEPRDLRVKKGGVLDLSSFDDPTKQVVVDGYLNVIFEPGSKLVMGGGHLFVSGNSQVRLEAIAKGTDEPHFGTQERVKWVGSGIVTFDEEAKLIIREGGTLGIEADDSCTSTITDLTLEINDDAIAEIGSESMYGGSFQVGNPEDGTRSIDFTLSLSGQGATFQIGERGFVGFGVGTSGRSGLSRTATALNDWTIGRLYGVHNVTLNLTQGVISHRSIHKGSSEQASLFTVGPATAYAINYLDTSGIYNMDIFGGGNMFLVGATDTAVHPIVLDVDATNIGTFGSQPVLRDPTKVAQLATLLSTPTPANFFAYWRQDEVLTMNIPCCSFAKVSISKDKIVYIMDGAIARDPVAQVIGGLGQIVAPGDSLEMGALSLKIDLTTHLINQAIEVIQ